MLHLELICNLWRSSQSSFHKDTGWGVGGGCSTLWHLKCFSFPMELHWQLHVKSIYCFCAGLFLDSLLSSTDHLVYPYSKPRCPDFCSFVISSEITECRPSNFPFLIKMVLATLGFSWWLRCKEFPCRCRRPGLIPDPGRLHMLWSN